jgi:hypothetical protein
VVREGWGSCGARRPQDPPLRQWVATALQTHKIRRPREGAVRVPKVGNPSHIHAHAITPACTPAPWRCSCRSGTACTGSRRCFGTGAGDTQEAAKPAHTGPCRPGAHTPAHAPARKYPCRPGDCTCHESTRSCVTKMGVVINGSVYSAKKQLCAHRTQGHGGTHEGGGMVHCRYSRQRTTGAGERGPKVLRQRTARCRWWACRTRCSPCPLVSRSGRCTPTGTAASSKARR